jgi:lysozyme
MVAGIDVSSIQSNVNWQDIANAGYEFAVIKNGNGNNGCDGMYAKHLAAAQKAGLKVACYNVVFPLPTDGTHANRDPQSQATMHWNNSQGVTSAVDLEWPAQQNWAQWGIDASSIKDWTLTYLNFYQSLSGKAPLLYSYPYYFGALKFDMSVTAFPLWIASYTTTPTIPAPYSSYAWWQQSGGTTMLPGTNTPVDVDYANDLFLF